jgi:glycosyltransferase involved in cell wall biosynthesis
MDDRFATGEINSVEYWNKRFLEDWIAKGGRLQTGFFAELCCRELPDWFVEETRTRGLSIFDYGCAVGDALPILQRTFPGSVLSGGDVAQVGLGLARALYPGFAFADVNAIGEAATVADVIYCSNTLEHFENWRLVLDRLARHAGEYVVVMVPFEEEDRIDEHVASFEYDSLPARLPAGNRLLHLTVVNAGTAPDTQWNGLQMIAIYGRKRRGRDRRAPAAASPGAGDAAVFDLRGVKPSAVAPLLARLAAMSQARRQLSHEVAASQAEAARLKELQSRVAERLDASEIARKGALRECADLAHGIEDAQRWVLDALTALDPALLASREISPVRDDHPNDPADAAAAHRAIVARLIEAVDRGNRLALAFHDQASSWRVERAELIRQLRRTRLAMERAIGERDREHGRAHALPEAVADVSGGQPGPLVSIVLPVYNQAYLVDEAIAAILAQTYENWELIVVDDGSTDDLEERVRRYLGERRLLFLRQPNQRLPAALNNGFAHARGEFLTWTSADNIMLPSQLERLVAELTAHPEAGLVYSDYWAIDDKGEPLDEPRWRPHNRDAEISDLIRLPDAPTIENFHRSGDNFIGASFLYRRAVAAIVGNYADDAFGGEDYDFWLRMHLVTEFRHVAEPLYKYRVHPDTLTARAEDLDLFANIRELIEADRWRIETLLVDRALQSSSALLRPVEQFHAALLKRCSPVGYGALFEREATAMRQGPVVVDVDVPARAVDPAALLRGDILLCRSELTAALLRREDWARDKRVFAWQGELTPRVQHAYIQAFADQVTIPATAPVRRVPARIDAAFRPARILIVVDRWSSGGLENIVIDLAESLVANGCTLTVAAADGPPPAAAAFGKERVRTLSFRGEEIAFAAFLQRERIEVVNYHHSRFGATTAGSLGVATVYTMHNCYLWMDDRERAEVAAGLGEMDWLVAVSRQVAQFAVAQFAFPPDRMIVIANGLSDEVIARAPRPSAEEGGPFTVTMVASLTRPKLQHVAIAAFCEAAEDIATMRLRLIGMPLDPQYHHALEAQITASPCAQRIELIPGLSRAQTIASMAEAQVFLLPSLVEGCSMALLEAAATGCVCIATDVGSARDLRGAGGSVVLLPSPLGELDEVTQQQFLDATHSPLPEHRTNVAEALRNAYREYVSFAVGIEETRARLRELCGMQQMTDGYLFAYAMAARGGRARRRREASAGVFAPA